MVDFLFGGIKITNISFLSYMYKQALEMSGVFYFLINPVLLFGINRMMFRLKERTGKFRGYNPRRRFNSLHTCCSVLL